MEKELSRFLAYTQVDTRADPRVKERPSSPGQKILANSICQELRDVGLSEEQIIRLEDGSLFVRLEPDCSLEKPVSIAFSAHLDTYFECSGKANPTIHDYAGGDIELGNGVVIPESELTGFAGKRIVASDGSSLLGADNKAGVAVLVTVIERIIKERIPHGRLFFWFCTDEELGRNGLEFIPKSKVDFEFFWTLDGKDIGVVDVGCFNGGEIIVAFKGSDAHPGISGDRLKPAHYAASRFLDLLSQLPSPWNTKNREPFYYAFADDAWTPTLAKVRCWPRAFDFEELERMALKIREIAQSVAKEKGVGVEISNLAILYVNTAKAIETKENLLAAMLKSLTGQGLIPRREWIRAGNNGAMLNVTHPNVAAPNLGTGSYNLHSVREFLVVDDFLTLVPTILGAIREYAGQPAALSQTF